MVKTELDKRMLLRLIYLIINIIIFFYAAFLALTGDQGAFLYLVGWGLGSGMHTFMRD